MTATAPQPARKPLPNSPCIGVCEMDDTVGLCRGCARTAEEVGAWREADDAYHAATWADLPRRADAMGLLLRRLSWEPAEILDFVAETLQAARGTWVLGIPGAEAAIARAPDDAIRVERWDDRIEAFLSDRAMRLIITRGVRAFAWRDAVGWPERIVLALPKARLGDPGPSVVTAAGEDQTPLAEIEADAVCFDLGLGRASTRLFLRTADPVAAALVAQAEGRPWAAAEAALGEARAAATGVIETAIGRAEVAAEQLALDPARVAEGRETPVGLDVPSAFAVGAIFHPAP